DFSLSVGNAPASAEYCLRIDLIRKAQSRTDGVRIGVRKYAIASPRTVTLVSCRAQPATGGRVWNVRCKLAHAIMNFPGETLIIPPEAIFETELASDFPTILYIKSPRMFPALWSCRVSDAGAIHGAEQETSVRQSNVATRYSLSLRVRKTGLCA